MELANRLSGIGEYYFSHKLREIEGLRAQGKDIINLGIGSPDRPPHPKVIAKLNEEAQKSNHHAYQPYKGAAVLRNAFSAWYAKYYGVELDPTDEILPLIGSKEGIMHICMTYLNEGDKVLVPNPGYPTYRSAVSISGGEVVDYKLNAENNWLPDLKNIDTTGVKMMILNYPHMPTGTQATNDIFKALVAFAKERNIILLHDNPYSFIRNSKPESLLAVEGAKDVVIELNSLSKSHNMSGWRVGMIGAKKEFIDQIICFKSNMDSGMFYPVQAAAAEALTLEQDWYDELNAVYYQREKAAKDLFDALGCTYAEGQAGLFIWAKLPDNYHGDCYTFADKILYESDVFITPGGIFGSEGNRYLRISLCASEQVIETAKNRIIK